MIDRTTRRSSSASDRRGHCARTWRWLRCREGPTSRRPTRFLHPTSTHRSAGHDTIHQSMPRFLVGIPTEAAHVACAAAVPEAPPPSANDRGWGLPALSLSDQFPHAPSRMARSLAPVVPSPFKSLGRSGSSRCSRTPRIGYRRSCSLRGWSRFRRSHRSSARSVRRFPSGCPSGRRAGRSSGRRRSIPPDLRRRWFRRLRARRLPRAES